MNNSMAKDMTKRYAEFLKNDNLNERAAKIIYFWIMSTIESIFWSYKHPAAFEVDFYASQGKMFLVFTDSTGEEHEFHHYPTYNCENDRLPIMLKKFIEIFNNIDYPFSAAIQSPTFHAYDLETWNHPFKRNKYNGFHYINIFIDMLPTSDKNSTNR